MVDTLPGNSHNPSGLVYGATQEIKGESLMGKIYSVGMTNNHFDVAPEHGRTPFYVDAKQK